MEQQRIIPGYGKKGGLVIVGEAPGADEDKVGRPFQGYSGQFLRTCLREINIDLDDCYCTNVVQYRPPKNDIKTVTEEYLKERIPLLHQEILEAQPSKVLLVGATAIKAILGGSILHHRGRYQYWNGIQTLATFHPAYVLRLPDAFRDFSFDVEKLQGNPCTHYLPKIDGLPRVDYHVISNSEDAFDLLLALRGSGKVTLDIETSNVNPRRDEFLSHGFAVSANHVDIIPDGVIRGSVICRAALHRLLESGYNVGQNLSYEYAWYKSHYGINLKIGFDTMLNHYAIDERAGDDGDGGGAGGSYHGLKTLGGIYYDAPDWSEPMKPYRGDYSKAPKEILYRYQALDISVTHRLEEDLKVEVAKENVVSLVNNILQPATTMLTDVELTGIKIDRKYFETLGGTKVKDKKDKLVWQGGTWEKDLEDNLRMMRVEIGDDVFNPNSPQQVSRLLFDQLSLPRVDGNCTDKHVIAKLVYKFPNHKILNLIKNYRRDTHILGKDIRGMMELADEEDRLYTNFLLHGTPTGRLASRKPALQNIPARIGGIIRDGFIADDDWELLESDYEQLEFKVAAVMSGDPLLIKYIRSGRDVHSEVACYYFNCEPEEVDKSRRLDAKAVVFGILYGRGAKSIAEEFRLTLAEAQRRIRILQEMFPGLFIWIREQQRRALELGYSETLFGRKRRYPLILRQNKADIERYAINSPIQGTATDICLMAGMRIHEKADPNLVRIHLFVHDSILMSVKKGHMQEQAPWIIEEMEKDPFETPVKFSVEAKHGHRWGSLKELELAA